jgi:nucleotide-binding universal stress UspA family protein
MFDRILLAIDPSPASEMATAFAGALAATQRGSVHVFYVNEYLVNGGGVTLQTRDEASALVARAMSELQEAGVRVSGSSCVASCRHVPQRIAASALEHGADCIVLGSRRHRRLGRLFSFQVRERTTRLSALPVLTAPAPLGSLTGGLSLRDVALAEANHMVATPSS